MVRAIEIEAAQGLPSSLEVRAGDLLVFAASGGHVHSGAESVGKGWAPSSRASWGTTGRCCPPWAHLTP